MFEPRLEVLLVLERRRVGRKHDVAGEGVLPCACAEPGTT